LILDAYGDAMKVLFETLYKAYVDAAADGPMKQQAEQRFSAGAALAVSVRDRALALLPPGA
jgi:hypothetical protein